MGKLADIADHEEAVLAGLLLAPEQLADVADLIRPQDFLVVRYREVYEAMLALDTDGQRVEMPALIERIPNHREALLALDATVPTAANLSYYAGLVRQKAVVRRIAEECARLVQLARDWHGDVNELLAEAEQRILAIGSERDDKGFKSIGEILKRTVGGLEKQLETNEDPYSIRTGLHDFDALTGGFRGGQLIVLGAEAKMGKTAFALQVADHVSTQYGGAGVFSLEMTEDDLGPRQLANMARVNGVKLHDARMLSERDWDRIGGVLARTGSQPLFIDDTLHTTATEIRAKARRLAHRLAKTEKPLRLIVLDYLQLAGEFGEHREQEIAAVSRGMKALAKELGVTVMALSQLNRALYKRVDRRPVPGDLRDSGSIAQDADMVVFLYRDAVHHKNTADPDVAELIVSLNRAGPSGTVEVKFEEAFTRFSDLPRQEQLDMPKREEPPHPAEVA